MFLKAGLVSCYQIVWMKKMCICFHMFFKSCIGFMISNCLNAIQNTFGILDTQYSIKKQPSVFNTTYTIQSPVNCPNVLEKFKLSYTRINI